MSVEVTRLPSGLVVVTDAMAHLQTASLGVWVGAGSRDERPTSMEFRICSNTWPSRAPRAAARARSPRRSKPSVAISTPRPASRPRPIMHACCVPTCRSRLMSCPTFWPIRHLIPRSCGASRTSSCRRSERRKIPRRSHLGQAAGGRLCRTSRSGDRSSARPTACARSIAASLRPISPAIIADRTW